MGILITSHTRYSTMMRNTHLLVLHAVLSIMVMNTGSSSALSKVDGLHNTFLCAVQCTRSLSCGYFTYSNASLRGNQNTIPTCIGSFSKKEGLDGGIIYRDKRKLATDLKSKNKDSPEDDMTTYTRQDFGFVYESYQRVSVFKLKTTNDPLSLLCSEPSVLPNGIVHYKILFPGSEVTYRCNEGFSFCDSPLQTGRCLKNGSLTKMDKQCHQTTWINPAVRFDTTLPCPLLTGTVVEVIGSPSKKRGFTIILAGIIPVISLELFVRIDQQSSDGTKISFSSRTETKWLESKKGESFVFNVGEEFIITILVKKKSYNVWVNNTHIIEYRQEVPAEQVRRMIISDDITLRRVAIFLHRNYKGDV